MLGVLREAGYDSIWDEPCSRYSLPLQAGLGALSVGPSECPDGSLGMAHTLEGHRRRGLMRRCALELLRGAAAGLAPPAAAADSGSLRRQRDAFVYIVLENSASVALFEGLGFRRSPEHYHWFGVEGTPEPPPDEQPDSSDDVALLRKFSVHPTSSRRLQGLADVALMVLALLPTAVLRLIRATMGLFGVTEHRWRGISMAVPLSIEDRMQLELTASNLVAGRLGRRPDPPERGPVPPALQLLLDTHSILAAAASTAAAFGLPYDGHPEAALQAKLASYLRSMAAGEEVCTQDCFKAMRKMGRKAVVGLVDSAPARPAPRAAKPRAVAKAFVAACLLQHSRSHATTLIQLVSRLPEEGADLVETVSLIPLAAGAEYLRLLAGARSLSDGGDGAAAAGEQFAEQLEAMAEFGRLRPSDAKKEPGVQGMAINARLHEVGVVRRSAPVFNSKATADGDGSVGLNGLVAGGAGKANGVAAPRGAVAEGKLPPINGAPASRGSAGRGGSSAGVDGIEAMEDIGTGLSRGSSLTGGKTWPNGFRTLRDARPSASGSDRGYGSDDDVTEGLLKRTRQTGGTSSQADLQAVKPSSPSPPSASPLKQQSQGQLQPVGDDATVSLALASVQEASAASASATAGAIARRSQHSSGHSLAFTAASGPSTSIAPYPTAAIDSFAPIYGCPRSGAFAVHGREPRGVGLSRLMTAFASCHALPLPAQSALLRGLGFTSLEALRQEVELRKALCVAQALPVVLASLRLMCRSPASLLAASRTGSFAHVQLSLLSDLHRHERGYLEDTKGALDVLGDRLAVRFVEGSEKVLPLQLSGSTITASLPASCVSPQALAAAGLEREAFLSGSYGLVPLVFNQGINSLQSLGFVVWGSSEALQDTINKNSLERLNEYAVRAGRAGGPELAALNRHYGPDGRRAPKDTEMFRLLRRACSEVGIGRAVNCKSGKDRTALELAKAFADEVLETGLLPTTPESRAWLEGQFLRGLSYVTTSQNHGQPPAYAFNEMEILTLPAGWRPDWRLCGKVAT
ncbi:hypothetical protein GPECTOR_53g90 [Gonium pectorale]|uniref:GCN5-related N-acetyltransferase Rv2170-like domain-containing protein n=1 Tax=Gonium pectorale TaxID=33097 RepID=A0A150G6X9_GONPE|nr:hypothetical protein GPECTOR_53g90 [Gonium pectorale]|eukprot:KXZ45597.1 hypothetical protein GPECTOR_53g90 [Gonium pectorale]